MTTDTCIEKKVGASPSFLVSPCAFACCIGTAVRVSAGIRSCSDTDTVGWKVLRMQFPVDMGFVGVTVLALLMGDKRVTMGGS